MYLRLSPDARTAASQCPSLLRDGAEAETLQPGGADDCQR
jgi:hypothetical protein